MEIIKSVIANLDATIVVIFLAINLIVGFYYGRGIKNIKEYALGNRNFSTLTIAATIVATWIGGSSFAITTSEVYNEGLYFIIPGLADSFSFFLIAYFIAPRVGEFLGTLSVADAMGNLYGRHVRLISAVSAIFPAICNVTIQFTVLTSILSFFLEIPGIYATLISSSIVIIYSTFGGIKAVTFTDIIQFFTFGVIMPIIALLIWKSIEGNQNISENIANNPLFNFQEFFNYQNPKFFNVLLLFLFFMIPGLDPALFQRISLSNNVKQVVKSFYFAGLFITICDAIVLITIGIFLMLGNQSDVIINQDNVIPFIANTYLGIGFKGLFLVGITAMIMSTADSYINTASVLIAHDLGKSFNLKLSEKEELFFVRSMAFLVGIIALLLCLYFQNLLELILVSYSFYMPIVSVPLLLAIFGFRSNSKTVLIGMAAGFLTVIYFKAFTEIDSLIPGMLANILFFISSHYILRVDGGWVGIKDNDELNEIINQRRKNLDAIKNNFKNFNIIRFCHNNLPRNNATFVCYGFFYLISIFASVYSTPDHLYKNYSDIIDYSYYITLIFMTIFITYPAWNEKFKNENFISIIWTFSLTYNLVFTSCLMTFLNEFDQLHLIVLITNLVTLSILLRWQAAICLTVIGVLSSIFFHKLVIGSILSNTNNYQFTLIYLLLCVGAILLAFLKPKQEQMEETEAKVDGLEEEVDNLGNVVGSLNTKITDLNDAVTHYSERVQDQQKEIERLGATAQKILNNVNHELRLPVGNAMNFAEMLSDGLGKFNKTQLKMLSDEVFQNSNRLSTMILNMLDLATLDVKKIELQKQTINLSEMVSDRVKNCRKVYLQDKQIDFEMSIEPEILILVDPNYMRQTIDNLVINAITYSNSGVIKVSVLRIPKNMVEIMIKDQGISIPKGELYDIFTPFKMGTNTESKAQGRGVGLALCKSAVEAHDGIITVESNGDGATFRVILSL